MTNLCRLMSMFLMYEMHTKVPCQGYRKIDAADVCYVLCYVGTSHIASFVAAGCVQPAG